MKVLFITLEQSAKQNLSVILKNTYFIENKSSIYTYGMLEKKLPYKDLTNYKIKSIMGFVDVIKNFKYLFRLRKFIHFVISKYLFTHVIFVDSFDFSRFYLNKFNDKSIKFCQLIGPSVFIWKKEKAKYINKYFDHIFSIFDIERKLYLKHKYSYIGHPLFNNSINSNNTQNNKIKNIGIFLGSRQQEIKKNIPIIQKLICKLKSHYDLNYIFFITREFEHVIKNSFNDKKFIFHLNDINYYKNISKIDFAFACSGTVHLELSLSKVPHFIFYKTNMINYLLFKILIRSKYISLVNIFNKKLHIYEFTQHSFNEKNLLEEFDKLFSSSHNLNNYKKSMNNALKKCNFNKFNEKPIIDYLKKSSLAIED